MYVEKPDDHPRSNRTVGLLAALVVLGVIALLIAVAEGRLG